MENLKAKIFHALGSIYIPCELKLNKEKKILHISDTPQIFYPHLSKILSEIKPEYIVHTGDLVDNIKLENFPSRIEEYKNALETIVKILEDSSAKKIIISLGNHDNKEVVKKTVRKSSIIDTNAIVNIDKFKINISHYSEEILKKPADFNLFGHDTSLTNKTENGMTFLNGINSINIITLTSQQVFTLPYPLGINDSRIGKFKFGL